MPVRGKKSIADTYVSILPETSAVASAIAKAFRETDREAREAGRRWKREIEAELRGVKAKVQTEADTAKAKEEIDRAARDRTTKIKVDFDRGELDRMNALIQKGQLGQAQSLSTLMRARREMQQGDFKNPLDQLDSVLKVQQAGANFTKSMQQNASGLTETLSEVGGAARGAGSAISGIAVVGAVAGLIELAGVAASAAQALALIPAAAGAVGLGVATMAVGLSGVSDAFQAVSKAASDSGREQTDQAKAIAAANRSVVSSQRGVRDAIIDEKHAQDDVTKARKSARRELEDLNSVLRHGAIDEAQARLDLQRSTSELLNGTFSNSTEYMQAQLSVLSDQQRLQDAQTHNNRLQEDANETRAKGVDGNDQVVAANERLMHSQENIATALEGLALAQQDANDAATKLPPSLQAVHDAMANISPVAQDFVGALFALKPAWDQLKFSVQDSLFAGLGGQIQQLAGTYLPMLQTAMTNVAGSMNLAFKGIGDQLMTPETQGAVQTFLSNVTEAFKNLAPAAAPFAKALADIMSVGSGFLPDLAKSATNLAIQFSNFITEAKNNGSLRQFMSDGLDTLKNLGGIAWDLVQAFMAMAPAGHDILPSIRDMLHDIKDVMPVITAAATVLGPSIGLWATALKQVKGVTDVISTAFDKLKPLIEGVANNVIIPAVNKIGQFLDRMLDPIRHAIDLANHFGAGIDNIPHIGQLSNLDLSDPAGDTGAGRNGDNQRQHRGSPLSNAAFPGLAGGGAGMGLSGAPSRAPSFPWDSVAKAESSGNWGNRDTGNNGHFGGLQFSPDTWRAYGGNEFAQNPADASREQQIEIANRTAFTGYNGLKPQGLGAWETITKGMVPGVTTGSTPTGMTSGSSGHVEDTHGALVPNAQNLKSLIGQMFPAVNDIGGYRAPDGFNEHSSGEALDIMVGGNRALGDQINQFLLQNANALGLQYDLWQQKQWNPDGSTSPMEDRGSPTANHMDHVHARVRPGGASPATSAVPGISMPLGTPNDPTYIALSPNIPAGQRGKDSKGGGLDAKQFGQDMGSGLLELFGFDGSVFSDPSQWGITRLFSGAMNWATQSPQGGGGSGGGGGGGGGLGGLLQSFVPQAFGPLKVGNQQDAPVPFMGGGAGYEGSGSLVAGAQFATNGIGAQASNNGNAQGPGPGNGNHYGDVNHFNFPGGDAPGMANTFQQDYTIPRARQAVR